MFTNLSFSQRLQAGLALAVVFFLIFATNILDNRHFETVQETLNTVYEDRIVAQDYIYQLDNLFHRKAVRLAAGEYVVPAEEIEQIDVLLQQYSQTKLTETERMHLSQLRKNYQGLRDKEIPPTPAEAEKAAVERALAEVEKNLTSLAAVQVKESHRLTQLAQKSLDSTNLYSKIEIGFLILIGLLMQLLIFVKPWE